MITLDRLAVRQGRLEASIDLLLHVIDCEGAIFGTRRCALCGPLHDEGCRAKEPTKAHEVRWCDGNVYAAALRRLRAVRRAEL